MKLCLELMWCSYFDRCSHTFAGAIYCFWLNLSLPHTQIVSEIQMWHTWQNSSSGQKQVKRWNGWKESRLSRFHYSPPALITDLKKYYLFIFGNQRLLATRSAHTFKTWDAIRINYPISMPSANFIRFLVPVVEGSTWMSVTHTWTTKSRSCIRRPVHSSHS